MRSATPISPANLPSTATNITVSPARRTFVSLRDEVDRRADFSEERGVADGDRPALHTADHALARDRTEIRRVHRPDAALLGAAHDGRRQGMLAHPLEAGDQPEKSRLVESRLRERPS